MRKHLTVLVALMVCLVACTSSLPRAGRPAVVPVEAAAVVEPDAMAIVRSEVEALLLAAREAQDRGEAGEALDCRMIALERARAAREMGGNGELDDLLGELAEDLDSFWDAEAPVAGDVEIPEPGPVEADAVAAAQERAEGARYDLPVVINPEVTSLIGYYTGAYRERLLVSLERASRYLPFIREELRKAGLPLDLAYLPLIESAFNPRARSRARAQGLWQFMAGTGRMYGLRANSLVDERNDPYLSTTAAVRHLKDLFDTFGDWELALAAYNSGAGRVNRALKRGKGVTDFWPLRRHLPRETRNYVPAMWAALVVVRNPEAYALPRFEERPDCLGRVPVEGALDLEVLAERVGVTVDELADLNPALIHRLTPAEGSYRLAVPCGREQEFATIIAAIPASERVRHFMHVVRKGDTPSSIAGKYGSSVDAIMLANGLKNPRALRIGRTLVVPRTPSAVGAAARRATASSSTRRTATAASKTAASPSVGGERRYVVRRGDTLYDIARRHGITVKDLMRMNGLADSRIKPGDVLVLVR